MNKAIKFTQPMEFTGLPNNPSWAGYDYLQWTGDCVHPGIDYNWSSGEQDKGKDVFTIATGEVEKCIYWNGSTKGFGNHVFIKHILDFDYELDGVKFKKGDILYSHYCHLDTINVKEGQEVNIGDKIGTCGGSGGWASHLHIELRKATGKGYKFWPKGYSADWIAERYYDVYQFIEDNKGESMPDLMQIDKKLFAKIRGNSETHDKTVVYLEIAPEHEAYKIKFEEIQRVVGGFKSRATDMEKQAKKSDVEAKNRIEQVSRLKAQLLGEEELRKGLNDKLKDTLKKPLEIQGLYEGRLSELQGQVEGLAKQKGKLNDKIGLQEIENQQLKNKVSELVKGQTSSINIGDLISMLWEIIKKIKIPTKKVI